MSISVHSWKQEEADLQVGRCVTAVRQSRSRESSAKHARCLNMLNKRAEEHLPLTPLHHCYGNSNVFIFYLNSLLGLWVGVTRGFRLCDDSRTCCEQAFIAALLIWWGLWPLMAVTAEQFIWHAIVWNNIRNTLPPTKQFKHWNPINKSVTAFCEEPLILQLWPAWLFDTVVWFELVGSGFGFFKVCVQS